MYWGSIDVEDLDATVERLAAVETLFVMPIMADVATGRAGFLVSSW
ncbi:hypothetical protein JK358_13800 [Nocardia sp. 2]|uniref:Cyclase n=1 Tax=Nocardia acididurans TaxID=2802282 RepID=A0ABS1M5I5_9NOCA|nr:hypothetical protein [Nocardia acididurans]MBL1075469.1 hypothetical protein [Nocardia acididurans]